MSIDEDKIEQTFDRIRGSVNNATRLDHEHLEALIERMRLELILEALDREHRQIYRAVIDLLEEELEDRHERLHADRPAIRRKVVAYIRNVIDGLVHTLD